MIHLCCVDTDRPQVRAGLPAQFDALTDQPSQHREQRRQLLVEIQDYRFDGRPAGKGQQLSREVGGAASGPLDLQEIGVDRVGWIECFKGQFGVSEDRAEHVVGIMRHAAREAAHRLHLLCLLESSLEGDPRFFRAFARGDVARDPEHPRHRAVGVAQRSLRAKERSGAARRVGHRLFECDGRGRAHGLAIALHHDHSLVGSEEERIVLPQRLRLGLTDNLESAPVHQQVASPEILGEDGIRGGVDYRPQQRAAGLKLGRGRQQRALLTLDLEDQCSATELKQIAQDRRVGLERRDARLHQEHEPE